MRKVLFASAILALAFSSKTFAQDNEGGDFKPFKVDVSMGYAMPTGGGTGSKGGFLFAVEPKYAIMQQLSVGLRIEVAVTVSGIDQQSETYSSTATAKAAGSYLATGDYYFSNNNLRPFVGAGAGIFTTAGVQLESENPNVASASKFGGMFRGGIEYKHARFGLEYNLVGKTTVAPTSSTSNDGYDIKNAYIGVKFGVCIGGGRQ